MMDSTTKRRHECIKRFLLFNSGKKLKYPVHSCFIRNAGIDGNSCSRNSNREEKERTGNGDNCYGCAFSKDFYYITDALKYFKSAILVAMNEENYIREQYSAFYDWVRCDAIEFIKQILASTQTMCYLTFKESDRRALNDIICTMKADDFVKLLSDMCDFCDENNIK